MATTIFTTNIEEEYSFAYGPLVVRITGAATGEKYVLRLYDMTGTPTLVSDLRQP